MKHIISLGAGVQSSTMALMAAHGEITPMPDDWKGLDFEIRMHLPMEPIQL